MKESVKITVFCRFSKYLWLVKQSYFLRYVNLPSRKCIKSSFSIASKGVINSRDLSPVKCPDSESHSQLISADQGNLDVAVVEETLLPAQDVVRKVFRQLKQRKKKTFSDLDR